MRIQSLISSNPKTRLKIHSQCERNGNCNQINPLPANPNKENRAFNQRPSQLPSIIPSQKKLSVLTEFPKNLKNSLAKSNSYLYNKADNREINHNIWNLMDVKGTNLPSNSPQTQSHLQAAHQIYQKLMMKQIVWETQGSVHLSKRDLLLMTAIALNPTLKLEYAQHLAFYASLLNTKQRQMSILQAKIRQEKLKICSQTSKEFFIPFQHTHISLLSQGNLIASMHKRLKQKHSSIELSKLQIESLGVAYMSEQTELLMRFAGQQIRRAEGKIYECGVTLQSKLLEISEDSIDLKQTLISEFLQKMDIWIENLSYKQEFNQNLITYIQKEGKSTKQCLNHIVDNLRSVQSSVAIEAQRLAYSLSLFFQAVERGYQLL